MGKKNKRSKGQKTKAQKPERQQQPNITSERSSTPGLPDLNLPANLTASLKEAALDFQNKLTGGQLDRGDLEVWFRVCSFERLLHADHVGDLQPSNLWHSEALRLSDSEKEPQHTSQGRSRETPPQTRSHMLELVLDEVVTHWRENEGNWPKLSPDVGYHPDNLQWCGRVVQQYVTSAMQYISHRFLRDIRNCTELSYPKINGRSAQQVVEFYICLQQEVLLCTYFSIALSTWGSIWSRQVSCAVWRGRDRVAAVRGCQDTLPGDDSSDHHHDFLAGGGAQSSSNSALFVDCELQETFSHLGGRRLSTDLVRDRCCRNRWHPITLSHILFLFDPDSYASQANHGMTTQLVTAALGSEDFVVILDRLLLRPQNDEVLKKMDIYINNRPTLPIMTDNGDNPSTSQTLPLHQPALVQKSSEGKAPATEEGASIQQNQVKASMLFAQSATELAAYDKYCAPRKTVQDDKYMLRSELDKIGSNWRKETEKSLRAEFQRDLAPLQTHLVTCSMDPAFGFPRVRTLADAFLWQFERNTPLRPKYHINRDEDKTKTRKTGGNVPTGLTEEQERMFQLAKDFKKTLSVHIHNASAEHVTQAFNSVKNSDAYREMLQKPSLINIYRAQILPILDQGYQYLFGVSTDVGMAVTGCKYFKKKPIIPPLMARLRHCLDLHCQARLLEHGELELDYNKLKGSGYPEGRFDTTTVLNVYFGDRNFSLEESFKGVAKVAVKVARLVSFYKNHLSRKPKTGPSNTAAVESDQDEDARSQCEGARSRRSSENSRYSSQTVQVVNKIGTTKVPHFWLVELAVVEDQLNGDGALSDDDVDILDGFITSLEEAVENPQPRERRLLDLTFTQPLQPAQYEKECTRYGGPLPGGTLEYQLW